MNRYSLVSRFVILTTSLAGAAAAAPPPPAVAWAPCGGSAPEVECALVQVPLDHEEPEGPSIGLALARLPAADPATRLGTVFVDPGGPGRSGKALVFSPFAAHLAELLGGRFDVVGFDPRGVGESSPLRCFATEEERSDHLGAGPLFPWARPLARPFYERARTLATLCTSRGQPIVGHMTTVESARDLDLLRRAVGDDRLSWIGFGAGSFLGATYAALYPQHVRALVFDGAVDPRLWSTGWRVAVDRLATGQGFQEFLRLCDEAGPACALGGAGGASARYQSLLRTLRAASYTFQDGASYSYDLLVVDTAVALHAPEDWGGAAGWAAYLDALAEAVSGDGQAGVRARALRAALLDRLRPESAWQPALENGFEAYFGTHCADVEYPDSLLAWLFTGGFAERGSFFGPWWSWSDAPCSSWPASPLRHLGPWTAATASPALVVGGRYDGATAYAGAMATAKLLQGSLLLTYEGVGHTSIGRSPCVAGHVASYLATGALPRTMASCPAEPNPFLEVPSAAPGLAALAAPAPWVLSRLALPVSGLPGAGGSQTDPVPLPPPLVQ